MATLRNFSSKVIQVMADNIDDNVGSFFDPLEGLGARFMQFVRGGQKLKQDVEGLSEYLKYYMEYEDITKDELKKLLDDIQGVEDQYKVGFKGISQDINAIKSKFNTYLQDVDTALEVHAENTAILNQQATQLIILWKKADELNELYGNDEKNRLQSGLTLNTGENIAYALALATLLGIDLPITNEQRKLLQEYYQSCRNPVFGTYGGVSGFGPRTYMHDGKLVSDIHIGYDYISIPEGTPIISLWEGTITRIVDNGPQYEGSITGFESYGNCIQLETIDAAGNTIVITLAHMNSVNDNLTVGQTITQGTALGSVGNTGNSGGPHLHIGTQNGGTYVDPTGINWPGDWQLPKI